MWIPRKVQSDIREAIKTPDRSTHVFYITGAGGEGKTILLRLIGRELGSPDGIQPHFPYSGILDLYHPDVNSNSGLEERLSQALGQTGAFQPYRDARAEYEEHRRAGLSELELDVERRHLAQIFADCMNAVTALHRVVVALDTAERVQHEVDDMQKSYDLPTESSNVMPWLLEQLQSWQNCVVLLAGRPEKEPYLAPALARTLTKDPRIHYHSSTLGGFDKAEAEAYFRQQEKDFDALRHVDAAFRRRLWEVTEGRPIRLDLALEAIQRGLGFDNFRRKIEALPPAQAREEIDRLLIESLMGDVRDPSILRILRYLTAARRGLDAELLHHLTGWELDMCAQRLNAVAELSIVKTRPEGKQLFLHDEVYQLCDRHLLRCDQAQTMSADIAAWYDRQLEKHASEEQASLRRGDSARATEVMETRQDLQVDSLLYRMRARPAAGYEWFAKLSDEAIRGLQIGFDMRLRGELLAFVNSESPIDQELLPRSGTLRQVIDYDCAVRWARRYIMQGRRQQAADLAAAVLRTHQFAGEDPRRLAQLELTMLDGEALMYLGQTDEAARLLNEVVVEIEKGRPPLDVARESPRTFAGRRRNQVLGRAHNDLGYTYWMYQGHYELAVREFGAALPYFRASELLEEAANTSDNLGRVYAQLNERSRAEALVDDALELRQKLGQEYRLALSKISRAIVHSIFGEPHRARAVSREALVICERLGAQRGTVLACIALGRALRQLGALGLYDTSEREKSLGEAVAVLQRAHRVYLHHKIEEPTRLIEIFNELGNAYRARAALAHDTDGRSAPNFFQYAVQNLQTSIDQAEALAAWPQYLDSCEDLAQTYFQDGQLDDAAAWLDRAAARVPPEYKIRKGAGLPNVPEAARVEEYWLQLGKVELLRGHIDYKRCLQSEGKAPPREALESAVPHYFFAAVYLERFSPYATRLELTHKQLHERFKRCKIEDLRYIQFELLPRLSQDYALGLTVLRDFFEDTLGLALEIEYLP